MVWVEVVGHGLWWVWSELGLWGVICVGCVCWVWTELYWVASHLSWVWSIVGGVLLVVGWHEYEYGMIRVTLFFQHLLLLLLSLVYVRPTDSTLYAC